MNDLYARWLGNDCDRVEKDGLFMLEIVGRTGFGIRQVFPTSVRGDQIFVAHDKAPSGRASFLMDVSESVGVDVFVKECRFVHSGRRSSPRSYRLKLFTTKEQAKLHMEAYMAALVDQSESHKALKDRTQALADLDEAYREIKAKLATKPSEAIRESAQRFKDMCVELDNRAMEPQNNE